MKRRKKYLTWRAASQTLAFWAGLLGLVGCAGLAPAKLPTAQAPMVEQTAPSPEAMDKNILRYAVFPAPPYMIGAGEENASLSGIDVEIVQEIARRLGLRVQYLTCTWARCLELMKNGEADLLSSAYRKPEREVYMLYFRQPYLTQLPIAFYYLKGKNYSVADYEDLYQFNSIGVLNEASYFELFDQDTHVKKFSVTSQDQLFPMLLAGRLEVIAGYVPTENYQLVVNGYRDQVERSKYEYQEQALVYMTLSKKSPFAVHLEQFDQVNQQLRDEGFIAKIVNSYYEKYR
jgi:polar amino acid transport system substrate-binding protein